MRVMHEFLLFKTKEANLYLGDGSEVPALQQISVQDYYLPGTQNNEDATADNMKKRKDMNS